MPVRVSGGCHCGDVRFQADLPSAQVELLDCNCSICRRTGFLHLIVPEADLTLHAAPGAMTAYRFGTGTAEHLFCRRCGIKALYRPRSHPEAWSVNARCLDDEPALAATIVPFDGRNWEQAKAALG